ncbi:hypothetical protein C5167_006525 [Papaver somniferum]|uniref:Uncharacterized protein n=1 Tax=Papaver somniferum TaxID=3469 RepID=A0A4Y7JHF5_PAPSO|nr:hypothetical protein C5167_006525 [Papaver somniferum]
MNLASSGKLIYAGQFTSNVNGTSELYQLIFTRVKQNSRRYGGLPTNSAMEVLPTTGQSTLFTSFQLKYATLSTFNSKVVIIFNLLIDVY